MSAPTEQRPTVLEMRAQVEDLRRNAETPTGARLADSIDGLMDALGWARPGGEVRR